MQKLDLQLLNWIVTHVRCRPLDVVMPVISALGNHGLVFILLGIGLLPFRQTRKSGMFLLAFLSAGAIVVNLLLKPLVARERPIALLEAVMPLVEHPEDFSFPSGHTAAAFEAAFALSLLGRRAGIPAYIFACLMGFSRLYLYVHYPSDVLAGAVIGTLLSALIWGSSCYVNKQKTLRISTGKSFQK